MEYNFLNPEAIIDQKTLLKFFHAFYPKKGAIVLIVKLG